MRFARVSKETSTDSALCNVSLAAFTDSHPCLSVNRFFSGNANPPAGTVIDTTVTTRNRYDFYLVPMNVNFGTVNPTHYLVVRETCEEHTRADILQRVAYALTHMYYNWTGHVKVPAPCQYAHKLVEMVGEHLHQDAHEKLRGNLYYL